MWAWILHINVWTPLGLGILGVLFYGFLFWLWRDLGD